MHLSQYFGQPQRLPLHWVNPCRGWVSQPPRAREPRPYHRELSANYGHALHKCQHALATTTVEHDYNNKFNERALPKFDGAEAAIAELRSVSRSTKAFSVHFGPIASGDEDVVETERKRALHESTGALAVAWEGAGGARACAFNRIPFIEIRGVTDTADHNAASDFEENLEVAMCNLATLTTCWTNREWQKESE